MSPASRTPVDFWFDPVCPWAWMASRWLLEAARLRDLDVRWHVLSLAVLNEGREEGLPERYRRLLTEGWPPVRIVTAVQEKFGGEAVGRFYTELGTRIHRQGLGPSRATLTAALAAADLPADLILHADRDTHDLAVRASHRQAIDLVGQEVGTPVVALPGPDGRRLAFFGPVVTPAPRGEAAARLWDGILLVAGTPGFSELKRSRTRGPVFE
ncbi:DsbA family protein [Streptomyces sp. NPDC058992]|uniref:mycothiol-dependent nitroreductase Rv2466c family protein n=1 Tax=unclassified Streptomyces TaxID=2593676 RepID=UPI0036776D94